MAVSMPLAYCPGYTQHSQVLILHSRLIEGYITDNWKVESNLRNLQVPYIGRYLLFFSRRHVVIINYY